MTDVDMLFRLEEERSNPPCWWYISFCGEHFLGAVIVFAPGIGTVCLRCSELGINPGGEALGMEIPDGGLPSVEWRERLLSKEEVERCIGPVQRVDSDGNEVYVN